MLALIITDSTGETHIHPISAEEGRRYTLGRDPECDIPLTEEVHLSRTHCIFTVYGGQLYLQDNNSSNGIFVGSRNVTEEYMATEREYTMGKCTVVLIRTQVAEDTDTLTEEEPFTFADDEEELAPLPPMTPEEAEVTAEEELPTFADTAAEADSAPEPPAEAPLTLTEAAQEADTPTPPQAAVVATSSTVSPPKLRCRKVEPRKLPGIHKIEREKPNFKRRSFRTAAGTTGGAPVATAPKQLRTPPARQEPHVQYAPGVSGEALSLPAEFGLSLRLLNTTATLPPGTPLKFGVTAEQACYLHLLHYDCQGTPTLLVPGVAGDDTRAFPGCEMQFPRACNNEYELIVEPPLGQEIIIAIACSEPTDFAAHWQKKAQTSPSPGKTEKAVIRQLARQDARWASAMLVLNTAGGN